MAPHARGRSEHGRVARELAARPRLRPLVRVPRRRDAPVRARRSTTTTTRCSRRARTKTATTSAPTSPTARSSSSPTCARSTTSNRSSATSRPARATRRTTRRPSGSSATTASSTSGWDAWREATFARQLESGLLPAGTELTPRPHWVPAWDDLTPEDQAVAARFMECFAAYLSYTDAQIGRVLDYLEEIGDLDNTLIVLCSDNGASSEGGATRLDQRRPPLQRRGHRPPRAARAHRRARQPDHAQQLSVGLDDGRQHAVQALEARGPRRRRRRPVHRPPPARAARAAEARRDPPPVRARDRRPPDRARAHRHRRARRRSTASRSRRSTARASCTRWPTPTRPDSTRRSTSRCSAPARSTTTAGRR